MSNSHNLLLLKADSLVKVVFELKPSDWHYYTTESLWALPRGDDRYQIQNVPFHAYGVSYDDIVLAKANYKGQLIVHAVSERGGHSTYRVILNPHTTEEEFERAWKKLASMGSTYERATDRLIAIDIPPETDIYEAYAALESGENENVWGFEEAHCGHPLNQ
jgi:hypothetical protein